MQPSQVIKTIRFVKECLEDGAVRDRNQEAIDALDKLVDMEIWDATFFEQHTVIVIKDLAFMVLLLIQLDAIASALKELSKLSAMIDPIMMKNLWFVNRMVGHTAKDTKDVGWANDLPDLVKWEVSMLVIGSI